MVNLQVTTVSKVTAHKCLSIALLHISSTPLKMPPIHKKTLILSQAVPRVAINKEKQLGSLHYHCQKTDSSLLRAIGCMVMQVMHIFLQGDWSLNGSITSCDHFTLGVCSSPLKVATALKMKQRWKHYAEQLQKVNSLYAVQTANQWLTGWESADNGQVIASYRKWDGWLHVWSSTPPLSLPPLQPRKTLISSIVSVKHKVDSC